jgi:hypothetical protein
VIPDSLKPYLTLIKAGIGVALLVAAFIGGCSHERDHWTQKWADRDAGDKVIADKAKAEKDRQDKAAAAAEKDREKELADLRAYRDAHPIGAVRLCVPVRPSILPAPASTIQGNGGPSTSSPAVQPLPAGDSTGGPPGEEAGPDISGMLDALAARADYVSAGLREWQHR